MAHYRSPTFSSSSSFLPKLRKVSDGGDDVEDDDLQNGSCAARMDAVDGCLERCWMHSARDTEQWLHHLGRGAGGTRYNDQDVDIQGLHPSLLALWSFPAGKTAEATASWFRATFCFSCEPLRWKIFRREMSSRIRATYSTSSLMTNLDVLPVGAKRSFSLLRHSWRDGMPSFQDGMLVADLVFGFSSAARAATALLSSPTG